MKCRHVQFIPLWKRLQSRHYDNSRSALLSHLGGSNQLVAIPCGKCIYCRMSTAMNYAVRLSLDWTCKDLLSTYNIYFATLTYDDDFVHVTKKGNLTNSLDDMTGFRDRLYDSLFPYLNGRNGKRVEHDVDDFEYMLCSEYGGKSHRPHMHIIAIVNNCDKDTFLQKLHECWQFGNIQMDGTSELGVGAVSYVASFHSVKTGLFDYAKLKNSIPEHVSNYVKKVCADEQFLMPKAIYSRPAIGTFICRSQHPKIVALLDSIKAQNTPYPVFTEPLSNSIRSVPVIPNYIDKMFSEKQLYMRALAWKDNININVKDKDTQNLFKGNITLNDLIHNYSSDEVIELIKTRDCITKSKL